MSLQNEFLFYPHSEQLASALADELARLILMVVDARAVCHMVFPGGRSPYMVLEKLRGIDLPWKSLHLYPSDERCVPPGDAARNDRLIDELLLGQVSLPAENLHRIPAELGPEEGAFRYSQLLKKTARFDIALLGMGPDGHIASLFPNHPAIYDSREAVPVLNAPKPPSSRISIGLQRLKQSLNRLVVVIGDDKLPLLNSWGSLRGTPVALIEPNVFYIHKASSK
ncbi:MAG: 6-phosphogluconolactonase [Deltaproteobacteria bacterium HGW-Deltaproteobacteria-12]|jgi:6-phosphogluconolactonase|nr:MAG: 6-phosphogluconolactonase [Deltaproteobacteria bacterium HGW-Deltaproteobacteria-12]